MKLGLTLGSLRLTVRDAISRASTVGLAAFDVDATSGEVTPDLSHTGRRDFRRYAHSCGMEIIGLGGDFGQDLSREGTDKLFEKTKRLIDLATDLRASVVTTRIGRIPVEEKGKEWERIKEVMDELGAYAERYERLLATYIGETEPARLKGFLMSLKTEAVRVCYEPSLLILRGLDPVETVHELGNYIVHAHARDVQKGEKGYIETIPGEGVVPFRDYILALYEVSYQGYHMIKREGGDGRIEDIIKAKEFMETLL